MTKTISAWEARRNFGKIMNDVAVNRATLVVESHGAARMALVPTYILEDWEARRRHLFETWESVAQRANLSEVDADALAQEAVEWARLAMHTEEPEH